MNNKINSFLVCFGAISLILLPAYMFYEHKNKVKLEQIESNFYNLQDEILEMADTNEKIFLKLKVNDTYDYYNYDDYSTLMNKYEDLLENIIQPNVPED